MTEAIQSLDPKIITSNPAVQCVLDIMEEYEATHTNEDCGRMWGWLRDELKASMEVPK